MLRVIYISLLALASVWSREPLKARPMPTISNSLVNLGKMDIAFYIAKDSGPPVRENVVPFNSKPIPIVDECLCNSLRSINNNEPLGGASSLLNKIMRSNDLFNFNKDVTYGPQCCESHEESIVTFEFGTKELGNSPKIMPFQPVPPIIFDSFLPPKKLPFEPYKSLKPKAIEIFLFSKNKEGLDNISNKLWFNKFGQAAPKKTNKKDIKVVGDKDLKTTFDVKNSYADKYSYDGKNAYDVKNINDGRNIKSVKSSFDLKNFDNLKYETVPPVTSKKEIGIKEQQDDSNNNYEKEDTQKDMTSVSKPQPL